MNLRNKKVDITSLSQKQYGFSIPELPDTFDTDRVRICLIKGLLVFCASLGTLGSVISAFDLTVNLMIILLFLLITSFFLAFLHYNHLFFNLCYPVIFFLFAFSIIQNRLYVNSGYQAMVNVIREAYGDYFHLDYTRQATETITDRYMTITFSLIYLGFFLVVLLNIAISTYMSIFWTLVMTFPFLQFGLYIGKIPSPIYLVLLLFSYVAIVFLKRSGHYSLSENHKKDRPFQKKKQFTYYKGHGKTMGQLSFSALCIALCFSLLTYPLMRSNFLAQDSSSRLKTTADASIQNLVQNGFSSFFNRYEATGGISGGRLGGVSSVRSDYQTDLEVTFVPTSMDPVYLKAFTGTTYTGDRWLTSDFSEEALIDVIGEVAYNDYSDYTAHLEANRLKLFASLNPNRSLKGKMRIENLRAEAAYLYLPYYTGTDSEFSYRTNHSLLTGVSMVNDPYMVSYYPYSQDFSRIVASNYDQLRSSDATSETEKNYMQYYDMYNKLSYNEVPTALEPVLKDVMDEIPEASTISELMTNIQNYFSENYHYSLSPGTTPVDADFVTYFLEQQKEGYCAHFASAGTLLCRAYGIPARYVEGYVIQLSNLANGELQEEEEVSDWLEGTSELEDTGVLTVSVPDANAHAWTEIYVEGFGWIPVDFTPASTEYDTKEEYSSFMDLFSGLLFSGGGESTSQTSGTANTDSLSNLVENNLFLLIPAIALLLLLVGIPILCKLVSSGYHAYKRKKAYKAGRFDLVLPYYYENLVDSLNSFNRKQKREPLSTGILPEDVFIMLTDCFPEKEEAHKNALMLYQKGLYSQNGITKENADFFLQYVKEICTQLRSFK